MKIHLTPNKDVRLLYSRILRARIYALFQISLEKGGSLREQLADTAADWLMMGHDHTR